MCNSRDPETAYYYPPGRSVAAWRFLFIAFSGTAAYILTRDLVRRYGHVYDVATTQDLVRRALTFRAHAGAGCILTAAEGLALAMDVFGGLLQGRSRLQGGQPDDDFVRRVHDWIQADLATRLSVGGLAARLTLSREHLSRVFKQKTGLSPGQYMLGVRMLAACNLLKAPGLLVKEVAGRLGYDNAANFSRTFRHLLRLSPTQFRRQGIVPKTLAECLAPPRDRVRVRPLGR